MVLAGGLQLVVPGSNTAPMSSGKAVVLRDQAIVVDVAKLEQPARGVAATEAYVRRVAGGDVSFVFLQRLHNVVHAALVVLFPEEGVTSNFFPGLNDFVEQCVAGARERGHLEELGDLPPLPDQRTLFERASILSMTYSQREADIRFWRVDSNRVRQASPNTIATAVDPVVTVLLSPGALAGLLVQLLNLVNSGGDQ